MAADRRARLAALVLALAACSESGTGVELTIDGAGLTVDELVVTARFDGDAFERRVIPRAPLALPSRLVAALPARALEVVFDVTGRLGGVEVGSGRSAPIAVAPRTIVPGRVELTSGSGLDLGDVADLSIAPDLVANADLSKADLTHRPIVVVGESHAAMRDRSSYTLPVASLGTAPGDLILLFAFATAGTFGTPNGFALVATGSGNPGTVYRVYQKRADSPVEASVTITNNAATAPNYSAAALVVFRGVRPAGNPFDAAFTGVTSIIGVDAEPQITFTAPAIVANGTDTFHVVAFVYESGGGESWLTAPPGMVKLVDAQELGVFGQLIVNAGSTGTRAAVATFAAGNAVEAGAWVGTLAPE